MQQIQIPQALDVEAIERELGVLWQNAAEEQMDEEGAVMRARVANLIILTPGESALDDINVTVRDLSAAHPCRAFVIIAERDAEDRDIQLYVSSFSQTDGSRKRLSCEEIVLIARGKFVPELPSAALPLLVSDLPIFLWWRDQLQPDDRTFADFSRAADRLIIDSAEAERSVETLVALAELFGGQQRGQLGISDINWARLTSWRALLASFYDPPHCKAALAKLDTVVIEYSAPAGDPSAIAPQALLFAGWLASCLDWGFSRAAVKGNDLEFEITYRDRSMSLQLRRVDRPDMRPGRLASAWLKTARPNATFVASRHESGLHLETMVTIEGVSHPGRVLPVRNRSTAQLLGRELEILCNDNVYADAVHMAARMIRLSS